MQHWQKTTVGKPTSCLNLRAWEEKLGDDVDTDFILHGIKYGFDIIDLSSDPVSVHMDNHPSAKPSNPLFAKAPKQLLQEIDNGNYIEVQTPPKIISPLGVISKSDGEVRSIHDWPEGIAMNEVKLDIFMIWSYRLEVS